MAKGDLSKGQVAATKILVKRLNVQDVDAVVLGFDPQSGGHVSNMTFKGWQALMAHLNSLDPEYAGAEKMRRKLLAMAYELKGGDKVAGKAALEEWCKKFGYLHKPLNSYSYAELPALVTQYQEVKKSLLKAL